MVKNSLDLRSFFKKKRGFNFSTEHIHLIGLFHCLRVLILICEFNFSSVCLYVPGRALNLGINQHRTHGCFVSA